MNKIGWCSETYNPVIGCKNNCSYCYARKINQRFKFIKDWNNPEWREKSFDKKFPQKTQKIFVGSMSEIAHWKKEWIEKVIEKIKQYPQHIFQFLTKYPEIYSYYIFPKNCWLGTTIVDNKSLKNIYFISHLDNTRFISIEPILESINSQLFDDLNLDWIIVGAETGNRRGKVIPKLEWIDDIIYYCRKNNIPIYLKDSLKHICPSLWKIIPIMKNQPSFLSYRPIKEFPEVK